MGVERGNGESENQISIMISTEHMLSLFSSALHQPRCSSRILGIVVGNQYAMALRVKY